jgi:hypothetical protein
MSLAQHADLDLVRATSGALKQDGRLGDCVKDLLTRQDEHEALVSAVGLLEHPAAALQLDEHVDEAQDWVSAMALHWVAARAATEREEALNGLSPWHLPWTPGRNSIWGYLFGTSTAGGPGMFSADRAAFVDPHEAGDSAVDHHPLADLLGRWATKQASKDAVNFGPQREDVRRVVTELIRNVAEHAGRPDGRPDACLVLATIASRRLRIAVADVGTGVANTARARIAGDGIPDDDVQLTWALFDRSVSLVGSARNRGLPQLKDIARRWPGAAIRLTSAGADLRLTSETGSGGSVQPPLGGTVVSFVAPI